MAVDVTAPLVYAVTSLTGADFVTVSWRTDELANSMLRYGLTPGYELGSVAGTGAAFEHTITIPGLDSATTYYVELSATDSSSNVAMQPLILETSDGGGGGPSAVVSDDFNRFNLDPTRWTFVDPLGDACVELVGTNTQDALLAITVAEGATHTAWTTLNAPRIVQTVTDTDFIVEVKFQSPMTEGFQEQGIIVRDDNANYMRLDFYHDGANLNVFAGTITNGVATSRFDQAIAPAVDSWLRVTRTGDQWSQEYSLDGTNWTPAASFVHSIAVKEVGVFISNSPSGGAAPAHTMLVDYFFDANDPIALEDGGNAVDDIAPLLYNDFAQAGANTAIVSWKTDEAATSRVEYGVTQAYELGAVQDLALDDDARGDAHRAHREHDLQLSPRLGGRLR